jgi:hypothetical protein
MRLLSHKKTWYKNQEGIEIINRGIKLRDYMEGEKA